MKKKEKEKQKDETDEEVGAETDEKQGSLLASTEMAGFQQRLWWGVIERLCSEGRPARGGRFRERVPRSSLCEGQGWPS